MLIYLFIDLPLKTGGATSVGFLLGAFLSALAGYVGMAITVRTSSRTAQAARKGLGSALTVAFRGGGVMGMAVVGFGLLAVSLFYLAYQSTILSTPRVIAGLGFGASLIAMFMRVSGGIYTKAADVGADLVGKAEAGIPEDDPSETLRSSLTTWATTSATARGWVRTSTNRSWSPRLQL